MDSPPTVYLERGHIYSLGHDAPRAIVYSDERDAGLAREVQGAGALCEVGSCLPVTLAT